MIQEKIISSYIILTINSRQSKVSHQSDEESQLSAYLQWLEAQHVKDDVEDDSHQQQQQYRSYDDMDVPRHPRDLAMKGER